MATRKRRPRVPPTNGQPAPSHLIPHDLAQATIDYLSQRPYAEVYVLIAAWIDVLNVTPQDTVEPASEADAGE